MAYKITNYTKKKAKEIGVEVKPSKLKGKKIDVFKGGKKIFSLGASGYPDYPTLMAQGKKAEARKRRKSFKARFKKKIQRKYSGAWYVDKLLW